MPDNINELVQALSAADPAERLAAAETLARRGPEAVEAASALVRACGDEDEQVRDWVVAALEELPPPPAQAGELAGLLSQSQIDVAYWAATLLGRMGSEASAAVDDLIIALTTHPEVAVRQRAAWALGKIGPDAQAALAALQSAAESDDAALARFAGAAIQSIRQ